jgi:hypothetical protein
MFQNQQMMYLKLLKSYQNIMQEVWKSSSNKNKKSLAQPKRLQARNKKEENLRKTFNKYKNLKSQERSPQEFFLKFTSLLIAL